MTNTQSKKTKKNKKVTFIEILLLFGFLVRIGYEKSEPVPKPKTRKKKVSKKKSAVEHSMLASFQQQRSSQINEKEFERQIEIESRQIENHIHELNKSANRIKKIMSRKKSAGQRIYEPFL